MARSIFVLVIFIAVTIQYSDGANLPENIDSAANSSSMASLPLGITQKTIYHKRTDIPSIDEIILDEEFIVVPKEKNKTTNLLTQKPQNIPSFKTKSAASNTINKKNNTFNLEKNSNEEIESLDATNTEPTSTSTSNQPVTTEQPSTTSTKPSSVTSAKNNAVLIGVGVGVGVLVVGACCLGGILSYRKKKKTRVDAEAAERRREEQYRRRTNFTASRNSDYLEHLGQVN